MLARNYSYKTCMTEDKVLAAMGLISQDEAAEMKTSRKPKVIYSGLKQGP